MNKYIKKIIFIVIMLFAYTLIDNPSVYAVSDFCDENKNISFIGNNPASAGTTSLCGNAGTNCYSLRYSGMRVALIDGATGQKVENTKIIDIWFYGFNTPETSNGKTISIYSAGADANLGKNAVYFTQKRMRQEYENIDANTNFSDYITILKNTSIINTTTHTTILPDTYFDDDLNAGKTNPNDNNNKILYGMVSDWSSQLTPNNENYVFSKSYKNVRMPNSAYFVMRRVYCDASETKDATGSYNGTYLKKLLELMNFSLSKVEKRYYLQYEPLVTWSNRDQNGNSYAFQGTITEMGLVFKYSSNIFTKSITDTYGSMSKTPFNGTNAASLYSIAKLGTYMKNQTKTNTEADNFTTIPANLFSSADKTNDGYNVTENTSGKYILEKNGNKFKAYGVGFLSLKDFGGCNENARLVIKQKGYDEDNYIKMLKANSAINAVCFKESGEFDKEQCYQLMPEYISKVGIVAEKDSYGKEIDICAPISCEDALKYTPNVLSSKFDPASTSYVGRLEEYFGKGIENAYDKGIKYLLDNSKIFFGEDVEVAMLDYTNYKQLNIPASCTGVPDCSDTKTKLTCDETKEKDGEKLNIVKLSDSNKFAECIQRGFAYNNLTVDKKFQTSLDSNFDVNGNKGYCSESVEIEFPRKPELTKAGKLIAWGKDDAETVQKEGKFGTMTVKRTCYYGGVGLSNKNVALNTSWIGTINPEINLYYRDGLPSDVSFSDTELGKYTRGTPKKLKVELDKVVIDDINKGTTAINITDYNAGYNWKETGYTVINSFTTTASYEINYDNNLKWYADKSNSGSYVDEANVEKDETTRPLAKYLPIGYGLPTSFITPTKKNYGGNAENTDTLNGQLYVTMYNIGSKVDGNDYHFNHFLIQNLTDDSSNEKGEKSRSELVYSCNFDIYNELFGYDAGKVDNTKTPKGLDVVFRTIKLVDSEDNRNDAFPGRSGNGRDLGSNWSKLENSSIDSDKVLFSKLINNSIYEERPLYHIVLTPGKIRDIRENNKSTRDAYINMTEDLYVFTKNNMVDLSDADLNSYCEPLDCTDSDNEEECKRTNLISANKCSKIEYYKSNKGSDDYEPYKYAASIYLSELHTSYGLNGVCMTTYGSDTDARSDYYAQSEGCKSNLYLTN